MIPKEELAAIKARAEKALESSEWGASWADVPRLVEEVERLTKIADYHDEHCYAGTKRLDFSCDASRKDCPDCRGWYGVTCSIHGDCSVPKKAAPGKDRPVDTMDDGSGT